MTARRAPRGRTRWAAAGGLAVVASATLVVNATSAPAADDDQLPAEAYVGQVEVEREVGRRAAAAATTLRGTVFADTDRDSRSDRAEEGVPGVAVSNGREVVLTDDNGDYELPAYDGMTVFVTKPDGWDVPLDEQNFPQFFYHHLPAGSPPLRFDGLPPTGPLPSAVNFPMVEAAEVDSVNCAVIGDTQTYSNAELGYLRDGVVKDLRERQQEIAGCGTLIVGDVAGDDLGLYPRIKEVMSLTGAPVRAVPGNHDIDFDATTDEHSFDTYKREIGPAYYSYDIGDAHFVGLDNVRYPCTPEDDDDGLHDFCNDPAEHPTYSGVIGDEQLTWLENDLALVPEDKLVVIATHIPLVSYLDQNFVKHQTDDVTALYALLEGRPALSLSGHTQVVENLAEGDSYAGWRRTVGVTSVPFRHMTVGAASGSWWTGDLSTAGSTSGITPETIQREGAPPGYLNLEMVGNSYRDTYRATGRPAEQQMHLGVNSPFFRDWYQALADWDTAQSRLPDRDPRAVPPVNVNDLGDPNLLTRDDLAAETWLMANVWNGETATEVTVQVDDREPERAVRTQRARGEGIREGAEYGDPYSLIRHLQVGRYSLESTSGNERAQGWEAYRGSDFGPGPTQPLNRGLWADQSSHLWRLPLPADLGVGGHVATVTARDPDGREFTDTLVFEVVDDRPQHFFRTEVFADAR